MIDDAIQIQAAGVTLTTGAASTNSAIPNTASGTRPNYARIQSTAFCFVKFGAAGVTATSNDILLSPNESEIYKVSGNTYIAGIQQAAAGLLNVTPLEDL